MASDDLQFTHVFAELHVVWDKLRQPIRASSRLKYTSLSVCSRYISLGSSTGAVYIFDKASLRLLHHLPGEKEGAIVNLQFAPNENVIASATSEGTVVVTELNITRRSGSRYLKTVTEQRGSTVTDMVWNDVGTQLYIGDDRGRVLRTNISLSKAKDILLAPNEFIVKSEGGAIVQLCMWDMYLLASTLTRTWLCDTNRREYYAIGKQERNGKFGSCFYVTGSGDDITWSNGTGGDVASGRDVRILCARPRSRVWEATLQAQVVNTHQLKQRLASPALPVIRLRDEPLNLTGIDQTDEKTKIVNFFNLYPTKEGYVFTWAEDGIYVFDPSRPNSVIWSNIRDLTNVEVFEKEIFYLDSENRVMCVAMVTPDRLIAELFSHDLFSQCAELCLSYSFYVVLKQARKHVPFELIEKLIPKIDGDLLVERLRELMGNLNVADESADKTEPVDDVIMSANDVIEMNNDKGRIVSDVFLELQTNVATSDENEQIETATENENSDSDSKAAENVKSDFEPHSERIECDSENGDKISSDIATRSTNDDKTKQNALVDFEAITPNTTNDSISSEDTTVKPVAQTAPTVANEATHSVKLFKNYADTLVKNRLQELLFSPLPVINVKNIDEDRINDLDAILKGAEEDLTCHSESEVIGLAPVVDVKIQSAGPSPKTSRKKNLAKKSRTAVVEFGEPVGKKNVKGSIVAYAEKPKSIKISESDAEPGSPLTPHRSFSAGDLKNKATESALVVDKSIPRRGSFAGAKQNPDVADSQKTDSSAVEKTDEASNEYDENVVPLPLHTSGQPVDPTLRKLKQFSEKFKSNSQVFLKNLKENFKEKALDSFRENLALDPMNAYFYPDAQLSESLDKQDPCENEPDKEEDADQNAAEKSSNAVDVTFLEESTKIANMQLGHTSEPYSTGATLENWLSVLHQTMTEFLDLSTQKLDTTTPTDTESVSLLEKGETVLENDGEKKEPKDTSVIFQLSSDSSELESSGEVPLNTSNIREKGNVEASDFVLAVDPFGMSEDVLKQMGELLSYCIEGDTFGQVDSLADKIIEHSTRLTACNALTSNHTRLVFLTSSDSTNESSDSKSTTDVGQEDKVNSNEVFEKTDNNSNLSENTPHGASEDLFAECSGPLKESTTRFMSFMRCYFCFFEQGKVKEKVHGMERTERYRVWKEYMRCLKVLSTTEPLHAVLDRTDLNVVKTEDLSAELGKSRAPLAHLQRLLSRVVSLVSENMLASMEGVTPLDVFYLTRASRCPQLFLRYMDQRWRRANDSEMIMTSVCSDEELKEAWVQVLLNASKHLENKVRCWCGMPKPFTHIHDRPYRSLIDNVLRSGTPPSRALAQLLWQRGLWSPWLQYGGYYGDKNLLIGVVVQLGDMAELDRLLNDSEPSSPDFLQSLIDAKCDQTEECTDEPTCWKCIECQRQFDLDPSAQYGPFSVPPHRVMTWEILSQTLVEKFGLELCDAIFKGRVPTAIVTKYNPVEETEIEINEILLAKDETEESTIVASQELGWISTSTSGLDAANVDSPNTDTLNFAPVGKSTSSASVTGWASMESFTDFWAPKPSSTPTLDNTPILDEKRKSESAESELSLTIDNDDGDVLASSEGSAELDSPKPKKLTHRARKTPVPYPDDTNWEILPEKRTPPKRPGKAKTMAQKLDEWEVLPEKWILGAAQETGKRRRKRSIEAVLSGRLKGMIGMELNAVNRDRIASNRLVELQPKEMWPSNVARARSQFQAIHKKDRSRKSSADANLVSSDSPCVICGQPLLVVGDRDPSVSIFPCQHGYHRACILTDDQCIKCFIDEQRKLVEGR